MGKLIETQRHHTSFFRGTRISRFTNYWCKGAYALHVVLHHSLSKIFCHGRPLKIVYQDKCKLLLRRADVTHRTCIYKVCSLHVQERPATQHIAYCSFSTVGVTVVIGLVWLVIRDYLKRCQSDEEPILSDHRCALPNLRRHESYYSIRSQFVTLALSPGLCNVFI